MILLSQKITFWDKNQELQGKFKVQLFFSFREHYFLWTEIKKSGPSVLQISKKAQNMSQAKKIEDHCNRPKQCKRVGAC